MDDGLRARKKQATRQAISDIAANLFERYGFDAVSIAHVATEAGVAKMTVTNYFAHKEDLVFDRHEEMVGALATVVATRPAGSTPLAAIRRDYLDAVARRDALIGFSRPAVARMIEGSPVLRTRLRDIMEQRERALADVLRELIGLDDLMARFQAAQLASVHRVLLAEARRRQCAGQRAAEIQAALQHAAIRMFDMLARALP